MFRVFFGEGDFRGFFLLPLNRFDEIGSYWLLQMGQPLQLLKIRAAVGYQQLGAQRLVCTVFHVDVKF